MNDNLLTSRLLLLLPQGLIEEPGLEVLPSPVITHVEGIKALGETLHIGGADSLQEVDVVLRMEAAHVMLGGLVRLEDLENGDKSEVVTLSTA